MHPMAAYCALKGLVLVDFNTEPSMFLRIRYARAEQESAIAVERSELHSAECKWFRDAEQMHLLIEIIPWDTAPDSAWDQMPQKLVDEVFG